MTQYYDIHDSYDAVDVWDHEGTKETVEVTTPGIDDTLGDTFPDAVRENLLDRAEADANMGGGASPVATAYSLKILIDIAQLDVQEGPP